MSFFAKINARQQMGIAALIMGFSVLISRFMGLFRDKVISWQFGASGETDLYFAAFILPDFLNYLLAGVVVLLSLILWIFAPYIVPFLAPGFEHAQLLRLTDFLRIILPAQICFLPGACFTALLYIRKQFTIPALVPLIYNGMILLCGVSFPYLGIAEGMEGFCWGVLLGAFLGSLYLPYLAAKAGGIRLSFHWKHVCLKRFLYLALPLMIGQSVVVLDEQFIRIFGSMAGTGEVSLLSYARRIMMVPVGVVAQAAGVASFPFLAGLFAKNDMESFCETLQRALKNTLVIVLPVTLYMIAAAKPTLGFIFEGGQFGMAETLSAAPYLQLMLLAVPFWCIQQILGRSFYAMENTVTPAVVGTVVTIAIVPFYLYCSPRFGGMAVAFLTSSSIVLYALALCFAGRKFFQKAYQGILCLLLKNMLCNCIPFLLCLAAGYCLEACLQGKMPLLWVQGIEICLGGVVFLFSYLLAAKLFLPENITLLLSPFLRRLKRQV